MTPQPPSHLLVVDIDNTLAENEQREHLLPNWIKFFRACDTDTPILDIIGALCPLFEHEDVEVIFVTGRSEDKEVVEKTKHWLSSHLPECIKDFPVFFRPKFDFTKAPKFKQRVVEAYKKDYHKTVTIVDDDTRICEHFKSLGYQAVNIQRQGYVQNVEEIKSLICNPQSSPKMI